MAYIEHTQSDRVAFLAKKRPQTVKNKNHTSMDAAGQTACNRLVGNEQNMLGGTGMNSHDDIHSIIFVPPASASR